MRELTKRQRQVLEFIQSEQRAGEPAPTLREIAAHFGFKSSRAAADHLDALKRKGAIQAEAGKARSLKAISPLDRLRKRVVDIPIFGAIPAGFAEDRNQEAKGCISIDIQGLGIKPSPVAFALQV